MEDELGGKIKKEFMGLRSKTYSYLIGENYESKKAKGTKRKLKFEDYKNCLQVPQLENKINYPEKMMQKVL